MMAKSSKIILRKWLAVLLIGGTLIMAACSGKDGSLQGSQELGEKRIPDQESWNSTLVTSDMGRVTAKIWYGHMAKYNDRDVYEFDRNIRIEIYDKNGRRSSWITAERGRLYEARRFMEAIGNVVAHSDSANITLYTNHLEWDDMRRKLTSDDFVTIATDQDTLYGIGFESEADLTRWYIKNPRGHSSRPINTDVERQVEKKP